MAYENMTYDLILQRMIQRVSDNYPNLDTREGSIIYNALAPAAVELAIMYTELNNVLRESFVGTASREGLFNACEQMGMDTLSFYATYGTHEGEFDVEIPIGSRWNCDLYNYTVMDFIEKDSTTGYYKYRLQCETEGSAPNNTTGSLSAITDLPTGLNYAELTACLIEGENEKSDEEIVEAYYEFVNSTISDGNVAQYKQWCNEYDGIGNSKVFPCWNGTNTVKVSILSASNKVASQELISSFQEYLDPNSEGMGNGVAPIGASVTVTTATGVTVNVSANVDMADGYSDTSHIDTAISNYFSEIAYDKSMLSYMNVGAVILACDGVEAINSLLLNDSTDDITFGAEEIPVLGTTSWTVV